MTHCLEDKALFLLDEGDDNEEQRLHLQSCRDCMLRYEEMTRDLRLITRTLQQEPPLFRAAGRRAPIFYRSLSIAAGLLLTLGLVWGERQLWLTRPQPSEQALNREISQFMEQVSEAIFDGGTIREMETLSSESDLASIQLALGEHCSDECKGIFSFPDTIDQPIVTFNRRRLDPSMQHMVSGRRE
jgi:hypothetical protein